MSNPTPLVWIDQRRTERGRSFDLATPIVFALPFVAAFDGEHVRGATVDFECPVCKGAYALTGDANPSKFTIDRHNLAPSLARAAAEAIEHSGRHQFGGTVWTTVELHPQLSGTAFGAVLLRGFRGLAPAAPGSTRITATSMQVRVTNGRPDQVLFLSDRVPGVPGQRAIVADLEMIRGNFSGQPADELKYEARFDAPLTIDTQAVSALVQIAEGNAEAEGVLLCDGCRAVATHTLGPFTVCQTCYDRVGAKIRGEV